MSVLRRSARAIALAALLSLVGAEVAHGQALLVLLFGDKLSTETLQVGINADVGWTGQTNLLDSSTRFNWAFGAYAEIKLSDSWRLQPELTLKTQPAPRACSPARRGTPSSPQATRTSTR